MSGILVYSEKEETALGLLTKGRILAAELNKPLSVALLGNEVSLQADIYFTHGATKVYVGDDFALDHFQSGIYAEALVQIVTQAEADVILIGSTRSGRQLAPRLAQKLSAGCLTDAINLSLEDDRLVVERRTLGGHTVSAMVITSPQKVIAVMPELYDAEPGVSNGGEIIPVSLQLNPPTAILVERRPKETDTGNIEQADVLICTGRGLAQENDLSLIQGLADALGGVVGCTRPISHEYHWLAESQMVGLSGKQTSPSLYIGIGISGQIQHTVGIVNAKVIVAINNDSNAPLFTIADYGIIGDLYQIVPKLIEQLKV